MNGAAFVYHGMLPIRSDSKEAKVLIPYVRGVLDALQIKNGPTHGEVMMTVGRVLLKGGKWSALCITDPFCGSDVAGCKATTA